MANIVVPYDPLDVHTPFHQSRAKERHLFGAMGSGKSYAVCAEAIRWCLEQPGISGIITRRTIPELRDSTEAVFFELLPAELLAAGKVLRAAGHHERFIFPNGSVVKFRSIDDWKKYKSYNEGFIAWDEMDEFDEETYTAMVKHRIRQRYPTKEARALGARVISRRGTWGASNPEGHNWIYKYFVKERKGEYFKSTSFDNPHLPPDYYSGLLEMPEAWIRRYVLCQFDDFGGQIYERWNTEHMIPRYPLGGFTGAEPEYPPRSMFWMGMDPGMEDPTAGLWVVVEQGNRPRLVGVAEYEEAGLDVAAHSRAWRLIEARHRLRVTRRIADPNRVNTRDLSSTNRLSDLFRRRGFNFELGASKYDDRIPALATLIENGQFVVTEDCPLTFESIKNARWKDITPAQRARGETVTNKPEKKDRHLCDTAEYLASRYVRPTAEKRVYDEADWSAEIREQIEAKVRASGRRPRQAVAGVPWG